VGLVENNTIPLSIKDPYGKIPQHHDFSRFYNEIDDEDEDEDDPTETWYA
jgi:hypothetical protein